jgi:hypothetical protein
MKWKLAVIAAAVGVALGVAVWLPANGGPPSQPEVSPAPQVGFTETEWRIDEDAKYQRYLERLSPRCTVMREGF